MAATGQVMAYRCEQCGSPEIVTLFLLYEQGTRSFSGRFTSGVSQSFTAKAASPPSPRNYVRALFGWGFAMFFCVFWGIAGFRGILHVPPLDEVGTVLLAFLMPCIVSGARGESPLVHWTPDSYWKAALST